MDTQTVELCHFHSFHVSDIEVHRSIEELLVLLGDDEDPAQEAGVS